MLTARDARGRQGGRPRARRRRLRHQAVQPARAHRADPGDLPARRAGAATQAPPVVDLGRVQVDLAGHRVLRDGQPLPIKPKAFELLAFLVRHPGQVFTPRPAPRARLGLRLRAARRGRSTSTSTGCARSSRRTRPRRSSSTRCAAWATCSGAPALSVAATVERMNAKTIGLPDNVQDYLVRLGRPRGADPRPPARGDREPPAAADADRARAGRACSRSSSSSSGARQCLEIGTFTGLLLARRDAGDAAPTAGWCAATSRRSTRRPLRRYWAEAGVAGAGVDLQDRARGRRRWTPLTSPRAGRARIDLALQSTPTKSGVPRPTSERSRDERSAAGGLSARVDNVLVERARSRIRAVDDQDTQTRAPGRRDHRRRSGACTDVMLAIADGMTLARKLQAGARATRSAGGSASWRGSAR